MSRLGRDGQATVLLGVEGLGQARQAWAAPQRIRPGDRVLAPSLRRSTSEVWGGNAAWLTLAKTRGGPE